MIHFQIWLLQIVGYCQFVTDTVGLRRAWIDRNFSRTSVTNFDELYEQIFDDLDSDNFENELAVHLPDVTARKAVSEFLDSIRVVDQRREVNMKLDDPKNLLQSDEWRCVVKAAERIVDLFGGNMEATTSARVE